MAKSNIKGLDKLMKDLSDPKKFASKVIDQKGGIEVECPNCKNKIKVPTTGTTCSCGQKITVDFKS